MKRCTYCGNQNEEAAELCFSCGLREFAAKPGLGVQDNPKREPQPTAPDSPISKEGTAMVLKCRTPGEAFLVAEELERADIITLVPDEETMMENYRRDGFVAVKVSAQAYEAAKELKSVIERCHWEERARMSLPLGMVLMAVCLSLVLVVGWVCFGTIYEAYKNNGYRRKAQQFGRWFVGSAVFWFILLVVLSCCGVFG